MVKVHLLKRVAGPSGNWPAGRTIEVPEADVAGLVAAGAVERIDTMAPYVLEADAKATKRETAVEKPSNKREKRDEA